MDSVVVLPEKITAYLDAQAYLSGKTKRIMDPIMREVNLRTKNFHFQTLTSCMWTEWLIKPTAFVPPHCYRYLVLMIWPFTQLIADLFLFERCTKLNDEPFGNVFNENDRLELIGDICPDYYLRVLVESYLEGKDDGNYLTFIRQIGIFPLNEKLKIKAVAEVIANEARKIHNEQTAAALKYRKQRESIMPNDNQTVCLDAANPST